MSTGVAAADLAPITALLDGAQFPALVTGAGTADQVAWDALRDTLAGHDVVLVVGTGVLRQYHYEPRPLFAAGTAVAVITADPAEAYRSPARLALIAPPAAACTLLARTIAAPEPGQAPAQGPEHAPGQAPMPWAGGAGRPHRKIAAADVLALLAPRLTPDAVVVEECPSAREMLQEMLPARSPLGYVGAPMGNLGSGLPQAIGLRMGDPSRPVLAVLGDGSAMYGIQGLWSAARYGLGVLFIVMANARYGVMDAMVSRPGKPPGPGSRR